MEGPWALESLNAKMSFTTSMVQTVFNLTPWTIGAFIFFGDIQKQRLLKIEPQQFSLSYYFFFKLNTCTMVVSPGIQTFN